MRHRKSGLKLNKTSTHRNAMFRNMVTSLFKHQSLETTDVKAKELRRWADHLITLAKRGDLHARRQALAIIREKGIVAELFDKVNETFSTLNSGYTRLVKIGFRKGDAASMTKIELIMETDKAGSKKARKKDDASRDIAEDAMDTDTDEPVLSVDTSASTEKVSETDSQTALESESAPETNVSETDDAIRKD